MRTVNFRDVVIYGIAYRLGLDPARDLRADTLLSWATFVNLWVQRLWEKFDWPEWTVIEERTPNSNHIVALETPGTTPIGKVHKVYLRDPSGTRGPLDAPFRMTAEGLHVGFDHGTSVWIKFTTRPPQFSGATWQSTTTYSAGNKVFALGAGNVYRALAASTNIAPSNDATKWELVPFPEQLAEPVIRGAYADALRDDGQTDKAMAEEQAAMAVAAERAGVFLPTIPNTLTDQVLPSARRYRGRDAIAA